MVDILLRVDGWQKTMSVSDYIINKGMITVLLTPPIKYCTERNAEPVESSAYRADFFHNGKRSMSGKLVFVHQ